MRFELKPYSNVQDKGVQWAGEIPSHWEVEKLKHLTRFHNGIAFKPSDWKEEGIPIIRIQNLNGSSEYNCTKRTDLPDHLLIQRGDLVFSWSGNRGTSFGPFKWKEDHCGYLNQHIFKLDGYVVEKNYFMNVLRGVTKYIEDQTHGIIGLVHITKPALGSVRVPIAPPVEQRAISLFLNYIDRRIQRYIRAKKKLIKLLEEQKQAIVNQAVSKGLNPDVKMKPSGIEWLGEIPEHWGIQRGSTLFRISKEIAGKLGYTVLSVTQKGLREKDTRPGKGQQSFDYSKYQLVSEGDFVMNSMDLLTGGVGIAHSNGVTSPDYRVFMMRNSDAHYSTYYLFLLRLLYSNRAFYSWGQGSAQLGRWRLPRKRFCAFPFPSPPYDEQVRISDFIEGLVLSVFSKELHTRRQVELVQEYRTRLISDVVTGKLDVREIAAQLPDEDEDTDLPELDDALDEAIGDLENEVEEEE